MPPPTNDWTGLSLSQGRYLVRAKLGEGGMGFVYRALDQNLDTDVVVKVPRRSMMDDPEFAGRFAREVRSLVKLAHPGVVKVTDVGEHDGVPYAVMQYLSGGSLEDYKASTRGPRAVAEALAALGDWLPGVAAALDFVHARGYVHRDVKPGNILFDAHGHAFLSDFGIAKAVADGPAAAAAGRTAVTGAGLVLGTPEYMAPELIMGQPFDGRIDQYALAVTVFEMLAGRWPFEGGSLTAILVMQTTQDPLPLARVEPRVPPGVSDAVAKALAKDPSRRFPSCAAFAAAVLSAAAGGEVAEEPARTPSGRHLRPDQVRLECPSCRKGLILPAALMADPESARGKRMSCPACGLRLRISDDGGTLVEAGAGAGTPLSSPSAGATRRVVAPRTDDVPTARPPAAKTAALTPPPPPRMEFLPVEAGPVASPGGPPARAGLPLNVLLAVGGAAAAVAVLVGVLVLTLVGPRPGVVNVDPSAIPAGALIFLDGQPVKVDRFRAPLSLTPGPHALTVARDGYVTFERAFLVSAGGTSSVKVDMTRVPAPPAAPAGRPPAALASSDAASRTARRAATEPEVPAPPTPAPAPRRPAVASTSRPSPSPSRPPRPTTPAAAFEPVPDGPPVEKQALKGLLDDPAALANRVVVPTGLFVFGKNARINHDGTATAQVAQVIFHVRGANLHVVNQNDNPRPIVVDPELTRRLAALRAIHLLPDPPRLTGTFAQDFGDTSAVLTFHVARKVGGSEDDWVPVLKQAEFLIGMNFWRIGEKKFKDSFKTLTISADREQRIGLSLRTDWSEERLNASYLAGLRHYVKNIKDMQFAGDMQRMDGAMSQALGNLMRNNVDPARALSEQQRARVLGR